MKQHAHHGLLTICFLWSSFSCGMSDLIEDFACSPLADQACAARRAFEERGRQVAERLRERREAWRQSYEERRAFQEANRRDPRAVGALDISSDELADAFAETVPKDFHGEVLDVGAGTGPISAAVFRRVPHVARVIAVERDAELREYMRRRFAQEMADGRFVVHEGDLASFVQAAAGRRWLHVLCSIPLTQLPSAEVLDGIYKDLDQLVAPDGQLVSEELTCARLATFGKRAFWGGVWALGNFFSSQCRDDRRRAVQEFLQYPGVWRCLRDRDKTNPAVDAKWVTGNWPPSKVSIRRINRVEDLVEEAQRAEKQQREARRRVVKSSRGRR